MRDYLHIGSTPCDEECAQTGITEDSDGLSRVECRAFMAAIRRKCGNEPGNAALRVKGESHDFGRYYEVVCYFDDDNQEETDYAYKCEAESPATWAEVGMRAPVTYDKANQPVTILREEKDWYL